MKNNKLKIFLSLFLALMLTAAVFTMASCSKDKGDSSEKTITVTVVDDEGERTVFTIKTASPNLRGALEQEKLVQGDDGEYGLYIKVVNGLRADYDLDGAYWRITKDGVDTASVDSTIIKDGEKYELTYTKA